MKKTSLKTYALWILGTEAVGALSAFLTRDGMALYRTAVIKPPLSPPPIVFPIAWTALYAMMGGAAARVCGSGPTEERARGLRLYGVQLGFNFLWSILFFEYEAFGASLLWLMILWTLILRTKQSFGRVDQTAGRLMLPYLAWVTFAAYLNAGVWVLNK